MRKTEKDTARRVRYPIGAKLVVIISILTLVSLGAITALVSWMVTQDIRVTAEENNFAVNKRSAAEAESIFYNARSNALVLLNTIYGAGSSETLARNAVAYFFDEHRSTAAVLAFGLQGAVLTNERFFRENGLDPTAIDTFTAAQRETIERASAGEVLIRNAGPDFGIPLLCLFFPRTGAGQRGAGAVLFSSESLAETFGTGANASYMVNDRADILSSPNAELAAAGVNMGNRNFVRAMRESSSASQQTLYTDEDGVRLFGAFTKLPVGNAAVITNIEYDKVFEGIAATTRRNIYLTLAVLFGAAIFIWLFSKTISRPMRTLTAAAEHIESGQFEVDIEPRSHDEIGALTESFKKMSTALGIFGRFTNREIAVRAMRGEIKPGGLPRHGTIFFSDIRGFTEKSENFTKEYGDGASERIVHWLNDYLTRMVDCVEKTGGVVDKFIGDAVMAHWGTAYSAGSPEKDALNCVKAALLMRAALVDMNRNRKPGDIGNPPIRIGCGINTGVVTAGQIGSEKRMEYTVIGDPVNLASRTEALNKPLGTDILITENTFDLIGKYLITEEMPPVTVKGKAKPVRLFAVVNIRTKAGEPQKHPATLGEVRKLLGIEPPDISSADTGSEEKKYKIGG
ncbi:adenylate/guanylate cyclase domain-containing protein [Breznakiella homolactica]|uniref:HAMP domain-containing protein n=1 Tax=Breznakiella homolactica TaxID=2798577 RepID=A0A7T7XLG2_9SPIR|nr:adenylate/guanylate cyclase domain-containing protein [Breznakiella homolactica]QQO08423.1 HAMP domain-containing protein [Breznakiella homolactica]